MVGGKAGNGVVDGLVGNVRNGHGINGTNGHTSGANGHAANGNGH